MKFSPAISLSGNIIRVIYAIRGISMEELIKFSGGALNPLKVRLLSPASAHFSCFQDITGACMVPERVLRTESGDQIFYLMGEPANVQRAEERIVEVAKAVHKVLVSMKHEKGDDSYGIARLSYAQSLDSSNANELCFSPEELAALEDPLNIQQGFSPYAQGSAAPIWTR